MAFGKKTTSTTNADILDQKRNKLNSYNQQFERAVSLITDTIDNLGFISQGIDQTMKEIDEYEKELATTREGLEAAKAKNDRVIANFQSLLAVN
jgi:uncharacterized coiled-coil DUF342 family protein